MKWRLNPAQNNVRINIQRFLTKLLLAQINFDACVLKKLFMVGKILMDMMRKLDERNWWSHKKAIIFLELKQLETTIKFEAIMVRILSHLKIRCICQHVALCPWMTVWAISPSLSYDDSIPIKALLQWTSFSCDFPSMKFIKWTLMFKVWTTPVSYWKIFEA